MQDVSAVCVERRDPIRFKHGDLYLCDAFAEPRGDDQAAGNREAGPVCIAFIEAEASGLDSAALYVQGKHGAGEGEALPVNRGEAFTLHAFAAQDAAGVREQDIDGPYRGVLFEEGQGLLGGRALSIRHDDLGPGQCGTSKARPAWAFKIW